MLILALALLILCSAFFAMAETALMAANKYRLRHLAKRGNRAAITTLWLLDRTDKLLSLVLIANTLINAMATATGSKLAQITAQQQSVSGVNLDEEATNLLEDQQMYQACSKVIQTAQSLFQTLLQAVG